MILRGSKVKEAGERLPVPWQEVKNECQKPINKKYRVCKHLEKNVATY